MSSSAHTLLQLQVIVFRNVLLLSAGNGIVVLRNAQRLAHDINGRQRSCGSARD
jgi:hypothetical protein